MDDRLIREKLITHLQNQPWAHMQLVNVNVNNGVVEFSGLVRTDTERNALRVAAQSMSGVKQVIDRLVHQPATAES
jgi:osmotically-inducible protein OsmY